jgi:hypothetical protein
VRDEVVDGDAHVVNARIEWVEVLFSEISTLSLPKGTDPYSDKKVSGNCFRLECQRSSSDLLSHRRDLPFTT